MGVHGVLDGQLVQAEHVGDGLHLVFVGFVQADPDECLLAVASSSCTLFSAAAWVYLPGSRVPSK